MTFSVENLLEQSMIYLRCVGPYGAENTRHMAYLKDWARENHLLHEDSIILGIPLDNPKVTVPDHCRYDIGLITNPFSDETERVSKGAVLSFGSTPSGKYGVFLVPHTMEGIAHAWETSFSQLTQEGYTLDPSRPVVERYAANKIKNHLWEICVPIL